MKIRIDIDCTPQEARAFFGLPDIAPIQEEFLQEMKERTSERIERLSPEALMQTWFPNTVRGMEELRNLWARGAGFGGEADEEAEDE